MSENPKNTGETRDEKGRFLPGVSGNPAGKPPGSLSPLARIRQFFAENPEKFNEWLAEYLEDPKNRQHLFNQMEGMPRQKLDVESTGLPFVINIVKDDGNETENS